MEKQLRSWVKSAIWRVVGVVVLAAVTYFYTRSWITTSLVTILHHGVFLIVFYVHERIHLRYNHIKNLTLKSIVKMFTYETICGNVILGLITYFVTGNVKQMTQVTITYIVIKHLLYVWNEFVWVRCRWGKT